MKGGRGVLVRLGSLHPSPPCSCSPTTPCQGRASGLTFSSSFHLPASRSREEFMKYVSHTHAWHLTKRPPVPLLRQVPSGAMSSLRVNQEQRESITKVLLVRDGVGPPRCLEPEGPSNEGRGYERGAPRSSRGDIRERDLRARHQTPPIHTATGSQPGRAEGTPRTGSGALATPSSSSGLGSAGMRRNSLTKLHEKIGATSREIQHGQLEGRGSRDRVVELITRSRRVSASIQQRRSEEVLRMDPQDTLKDVQRRTRTPRWRREAARAGPSTRAELPTEEVDGSRTDFGPEGSYAYEPSFQYMLQEDNCEGPRRTSRSDSTFHKEESFGFPDSEDVAALVPREFKFSVPRVPARDIPNSPKPATRLHASVVPHVVELRGSGFRKYRSQPQPKWKDHARLLREVQEEVEAELGDALSQARRRKAIELILHRYMSGAIEAEADGDAEGCGGSSEGSSHNRLLGL